MLRDELVRLTSKIATGAVSPARYAIWASTVMPKLSSSSTG